MNPDSEQLKEVFGKAAELDAASGKVGRHVRPWVMVDWITYGMILPKLETDQNLEDVPEKH